MSKMLEQAIVDASALKEAALKNAEQSIIEKYSGKIKEAVDNILEQDEDELDFGGEVDMGMDDGEGGESDVADDVPLAGAEGERLCVCPDEEEEIEINFDDLEQQMADPEPEDMEPGALNRDEFAEDELEKDLPLQEDEDMDLDEEKLKELAEELNVDVEVVPNGVQGANNLEKEEALDKSMAAAKDEEVKEEVEELKKKVEELEENLKKTSRENKKIVDERKKIVEENKKLKKYLLLFKDKMNEVSLANARLLYKNRVLDSNSLNERQKAKIAEAIEKAGSVEEAKTIYETLKNTVGSKEKESRIPKSLSEAIEKKSSMLPRRKTGNETDSDPKFSRWQALAGIGKNH